MRALMRRFIVLLGVLMFAGQVSAADNPQVEMQTNMGTITIELWPEKAPKSVENFIKYVKDGFYENTLFHRVIDGFMIQGGGFTPDYERKETRAPIMNEADNGLRNIVGTVAMARTGDPHSATSQFFINVANNSFLDFREKRPRAWGYAVFGRVVEGMDVVKKIKEVKTGPGGPFRKDAPQQQVIIEKASLITPSAEEKE